MKDEDYAIKYAEERRMRIALETRLHGMMYKLVPYVAETINLCESVVSKNANDMSSSLSTLTNFHGDMEINLLLNMLRPVGKLKGFDKKDVAGCTCLAELPDRELARIELATRECAKQTQEQWDKFAAESGFAPAEEFSENHKKEMIRLVMEGMAGISREEMSKDN